MKKIILSLMVIFNVCFSQVFATEKYAISPKQSQLKWIGTKVTGSHYGQLRFERGYIEMEDDRIVGGELQVNMRSLSVDDLEGRGRQKLIEHLKSDDFFSTKKFKRSKLQILSSTKMPGGEHSVKANLTIKDQTHPVSFTAKLNKKSSELTSSGKLKFDRTKFNVKYNSGSFFKNLGDKLIHDDVNLEFSLVAKTKSTKK